MGRTEKTNQMSRHILSMSCLLCLWSGTIFAQNHDVRGTVKDSNGDPVIGASILVKGTNQGTVTDLNGNFTLKNVKEGVPVEVSYIGYAPQRLTAEVNAPMNITLKENSKSLDEVVVIGYGSVKRKDVTTAVSTISAKDLQERPIISAAQAIQGKAAGVLVTQPTGAPGASMSIRVRGTTSFNGSNDPLYVVDGVPVDNMDFLSPNDIENIQILKDASSAAIYGSRAANGVVLVTTKNGSKGKAKISLSAQYGISKVRKTMDVLNTEQYRELQNEIGLIKLPDGLKDQTDWFKETYKTGNTENYQLSVSNGNEHLRYYLSGGYQNEKGIINTSYFKRYNFRANLENDVRKWLRITANVNYSDYSSNGGGSMGTGAGRGGVVLSVINTPAYAPIWDPENPEHYYNSFYGVGNLTSPLENIARGKDNKNRENRLIATGGAIITFLPELKFKTNFTLDRRNSLNTTFLDPIHTAWGRNQFGEGSDNRAQNTVLTFENLLTYSTQIKKHHIDAMAGTSWTKSDYRNSYINGSHYRNDLIQTLNAANQISWTGTGTGASQWAIMSYFGRLSYNYDSKYLFTFNIRSDGSSRLHPEHRWGTFPSFSGAWRISSEKFMKKLTWIDDLKLRGGWGQTGNQSGISDYAYLMRYNIQRIEWFNKGQENAVPTITQANLRTPDLTWETTSQVNVGIDFTAFKSRLTINLDYYYKKTSNMLMNVTLPAGAASNSITRNEGEMSNKGFEINVSTKNLIGIFQWSTDFNISFNRNKLTKLSLQKIYNDAVTSENVNEYAVRNMPGKPLGSFYGYISDGVNPQTGELNYRDLNGDGVITPDDRTYIGDPNPKFTYGMTNTFSYKNLSLSVFIQGTYGNDVFNASRMETEGMYNGFNQSTRVLKRWRKPGDITDVPKAGFKMHNSTYFIEDGSYLRFKDITLSYNVQSRLLKKWGITRFQPYITANNLITITKYTGMDPEVNQWGNSGAVQGIDWGTYPTCKSFVFGVNIDF